MKRSKEIVFCKNNKRGELDFFLLAAGKEFYLFTTNYFSSNIYEKYKNGQRIDQILNNTSKIRQQKLKERIRRMIHYVAVEESITFSKKTKKPIHEEMSNFDYKTI